MSDEGTKPVFLLNIVDIELTLQTCTDSLHQGLTHKIIHLVIHINHDQMNILVGKDARTLNKGKKHKDDKLMYNQTH